MNRSSLFNILNRRSIQIVLLTFVISIGIIVIEYVANLIQERTERQNNQLVIARVSELRAHLEQEINSVLYLTKGMVSYVSVNPFVPTYELKAFAAAVIKDSPIVKNIALAPDNVINFVYPFEGNQSVIGLDYRKNAAQWPMVEKAIETGLPLIAGPLNLVQGGVGIISRTPVYISLPGDIVTLSDRQYWGIVSIVIDFEMLLDRAGFLVNHGDLKLALRGLDSLGEDGDVFWGRDEIFEKPLVTQKILFLGGSWVLAARTSQTGGSLAIVPRLFGYLAFSVVLILSMLLLMELRNARERAFHDQLTGLPNRRFLFQILDKYQAQQQRTGIGFAIAFVDLNGFKQINDTYGHAAGDEVLREISKRLQRLLRACDYVTRTGGDEFVLLLSGEQTVEKVEEVEKRIKQSVAEPIIYKDDCSVSLTCSIGWAISPFDTIDINQLIALADRRMYEMKQFERFSIETD